MQRLVEVAGSSSPGRSGLPQGFPMIDSNLKRRSTSSRHHYAGHARAKRLTKRIAVNPKRASTPELGSGTGELNFHVGKWAISPTKVGISVRYESLLAVTREELQRIGPHERVHVEQYERWGLLFFIAYGASSLWQLLHGRSPYWHNHFEVQARQRSAEAHCTTADA